MKHLVIFLLLPAVASIQPKLVNEVREAMSFEGMWTFVKEPRNGGDIGLHAQWNKKELSKFENATEMPVPSAFNDMGDRDLRDHLGWVWYERYVTIPPRIIRDRRVFIRLDSVNYYAIVYINGNEVTRHEGGHLPFEAEITSSVDVGKPVKVTVAVNNTLSWETVPQATFQYTKNKEWIEMDGKNVSRYPPGHFTWTGTFDFFHYAGILRPISLVFRPTTFIDDFKIQADMQGNFNYSFVLNGNEGGKLSTKVRIKDEEGKVVFESSSLIGDGRIEKAKLWFPRGLGAPTLYSIESMAYDKNGLLSDVFSHSFGFRSVSWDDHSLYVNKKSLYCMGTGWHEESAIRGRSYDRVIMAKDLSLMNWMGVNCLRTTHYPYAEETIEEADRRGIAIVLEVPSVSPKWWVTKSQQVHANLIREAIGRDRHHPSVIMWSVSNEPFAFKPNNGGREYFQPLIALAKELDASRPVTLVHGQGRHDNDYLSDLLDVICVNRYYGWYIDMGENPDQIERDLYVDLATWHDKFKKPILFTEYGAEQIPGILADPAFAFSNQYQVENYRATHRALDRLRKEKKITGEMAWVFADFMTHQTTTRVGGNHKGLFTRDRQPKEVAYIIHDRYNEILTEMQKTT